MLTITMSLQVRGFKHSKQQRFNTSKHQTLKSSTIQNIKIIRELRTQQAQYVCKKVIKNKNEKKWKLAIVGMDMNDAPGLIFNFIKLTFKKISLYPEHLTCSFFTS